MVAEQSRIRFLDGLRGFAILLVIGFHYVGQTYAAKLPYGKDLSWIPVLNHGWVGVYLFFLISGYVIFMTLENSATAAEFFRRRWLRLFPAMLIASIVIFIASRYMGDNMPSGRAAPIDLLPGLTFIGDSFWHAGLHRNVHSLDGVFWTLYVEVGFYLVIGSLYFLVGSKRALMLLVTLWILVLLAPLVIGHLPKTPLSRLIEPFQWLGMMDYGWFAAGALFYKAKEIKSNRLFLIAIALAIASSLTYTNTLAPSILDRFYLISCAVIFSAAQRWHILQAAFESRIALLLGFVSYPLYLLHNDIGVGLISSTGHYISHQALPIIPLVVAMVMILFAWIVTKYLEPNFRVVLKSIMDSRSDSQTKSMLRR